MDTGKSDTPPTVARNSEPIGSNNWFDASPAIPAPEYFDRPSIPADTIKHLPVSCYDKAANLGALTDAGVPLGEELQCFARGDNHLTQPSRRLRVFSGNRDDDLPEVIKERFLKFYFVIH